jgi:pimeloyl-ACP methyl ester carboxylesterase
MRTIYALLVGIDDYPPPVPKLRGCINDIDQMQEYLTVRVDPGGRALEKALQIKTLRNQEATRHNVIATFREHLGRAGPDDVALFCYSGHGSQEQAPEQFWAIEPDHLDETLVLYDSRTDGSWDLADKELSKLITEVSGRGPHVVVVLDCCHSGSGTRAPELAETAVRRAPTDLRTRPPQSFIFALDELPKAQAARDVRGRPSGWDTTGRHVLLAACRDDEEAKEYQGNGATRGAFSYFLGKTLRTAGGAITYRDLFARSAALVRGQVLRQSPQLEATVSEDLLQPFLGGTIRPSPRTFLASYQGGRWEIDAGRVHGIPSLAPDDATELALFDFRAADEDLKDPAKKIGGARISKVLGTTSQLEIIDGAVDPAAGPLKVVITHFPTSRLRVKLEGDLQGIELARNALAASQFVREPSEGEAADFRLIARGDQYLIAKPDDDRPLVGQIDKYTDGSARQAIARLEHIERWKTTAELDNPASSIGPDELQVEILQDGKPLTGSEIRLEYTRGDGDEWINPEVTVQLRNTGKRALYVGLLDLPQTFGIFPMLSNISCQKLEPGQETSVNGGEPIPVTVPDEFWERGVTELKDIIKVIISTSEFDARRLAQEDLDLPRSITRSVGLKALGVSRPIEELGTLERLMEQVQTRHAGGTTAKRIDDWRPLQYAFTTVRPLRGERLEPGQGVTLTHGVRIEPHPSLRAATARLTSMPVASRAVEALAPLPRMLYDDPSVVQPFEFGTTRAIGGILSVLELSGVDDSTVVTPDNPLRLTIPRQLGPGEHVLPVAFDGEFFLPLGYAHTVVGETRVILERLPQPTEAESRSLGGALRILFQKIVARAFGTEYQYPILAIANIDDDFRVHYEPDPAAVQDRVTKAQRIALFIHGIIGDTREMAASLQRGGAADCYDLVLTFDYENLQEPIADTARALRDRLVAVGLGPDHGRCLDLIAHSMGGLVSRWFIEREGGNRVVRRLIMLGTPNGGSPWPRVQDWATTALAVGLNAMSKVVWPAAVLAGLVQAVEAVGVTLDQMMPDSVFLRDLSTSLDPKVPYVLISGNTSLISVSVGDEERRSKLRRLLAKLWLDRTKYELADLFFGGSENDTAVSIASMKALGAGREAGQVRTVACDHMSYFRHPAGLKAFASILEGT